MTPLSVAVATVANQTQGHYPKKLSGGHIIVGCDVSSYGLVAAFLEEFFHEDHGYNAMHVVSPGSPQHKKITIRER